jgi:hypothetical protein
MDSIVFSSYSRYVHTQWRRLSSRLRCDRCRIVRRPQRTLVRFTHVLLSCQQLWFVLRVLYSEQILRVKNGGTNIPAILVGNKIDLAEKRKVTPEEAEQKARSWSIRYIETSAKTKYNVDKVHKYNDE